MLRIPKEVFEQIKTHGEKEAPLEACGYLLGAGEIVTESMILNNVDRSSEHFSFDPKEQFAAVKAARAKGNSLIAVWHTHPASPARMSGEDIRLANDPQIIYVIYSLLDKNIKGFKADALKNINEEKIEVV